VKDSNPATSDRRILCVVGLSASAVAVPSRRIDGADRTIDAFNKGDAGRGHCHVANDLVIIDEVPPFSWQGTGAFTAWNDDLASDAAANGITDQLVTLAAATRVESSGDRAYVVVPAVYTFKQKGVAMRESAQMTFALRKEAAGWHQRLDLDRTEGGAGPIVFMA
jgi:ketosteroid isomerase-like protein